MFKELVSSLFIHYAFKFSRKVSSEDKNILEAMKETAVEMLDDITVFIETEKVHAKISSKELNINIGSRVIDVTDSSEIMEVDDAEEDEEI